MTARFIGAGYSNEGAFYYTRSEVDSLVSGIATSSHTHNNYQPINSNLTAFSGLTGAADRVPYFTGAGTLAITTLTSQARTLLGNSTAETMRSTLGLVIGTNVQAYDPDLQAIAGLTGTTGLLRKTAADTWQLDTNSYITGNQSISVTGDASGSGTTSISLTLANSGVTAGTYNNSATAVRPFTVDGKGRITGIGTAVTIAPGWSSLTSIPANVTGLGNLSTQGLVALVGGGGAITARSIVSGDSYISVANGSGANANPTLTFNPTGLTANTVSNTSQTSFTATSWQDDGVVLTVTTGISGKMLLTLDARAELTGATFRGDLSFSAVTGGNTVVSRSIDNAISFYGTGVRSASITRYLSLTANTTYEIRLHGQTTGGTFNVIDFYVLALPIG